MSNLKSRREFFFAYDIRMGNPNGDPDENRPRVLPDGTYYVTDVRLKRFIRDFLKTQGNDILVDTIEDKTTNLTGRVAQYLEEHGQPKAEGAELVEILLNSFIDARMFGSSFAFKPQGEKKDKWEPKPIPKTLTGAIQINHGEVLHEAEAVDIHGTSVFGSQENKSQGTFTTYFGLRYALIGFHGIANEHSAALSKLSEDDYQTFLAAAWKSVRSAGNTRTKVGQVPRLLISIEYNEKEEFQLGSLLDYLKLVAADGKAEKEWSSPADYKVNINLLKDRIEKQTDKIATVSYEVSPDVQFEEDLPADWKALKIDD